VKSVSGATLVFPTFQYENMLGLLNPGESSLPAWVLVARFEPKIDMLAVSSFPGLIFETPDLIPEFYYSGLNNRTEHPLALVSVGWSSERPGGAGGEDEQFSYLSRTLAVADALKASMFVWYLAHDPRPEPTGPYHPLRSMGLLRSDGIEKTGWLLWRRQQERPLTP
jgi:hypothetical protein